MLRTHTFPGEGARHSEGTIPFPPGTGLVGGVVSRRVVAPASPVCGEAEIRVGLGYRLGSGVLLCVVPGVDAVAETGCVCM